MWLKSLLKDSVTWIETRMNTERIYQGEDDLWYFNARGNQTKGPFDTYHEAEQDLIRNVRQWQKPFAKPVWANPLRSLKVRKQRSDAPRHI